MNVFQQQGIKNRILTTEQIEVVHEKAMELIERVGMRVDSTEGLEILKGLGCDISNPNKITIPRKLVEEAIKLAPSEIDVFDRFGNLTMKIKEDACFYGTGSDCATTMDLETGDRRGTKKEDIGRLAKFCDALPNIDFVMAFAIAYDSPAGTDFVHQYEAMLQNTTKPIIVTGHGRNDMTVMAEMASVICGGKDKLKEKPPLILYTEPLSPLIHTKMGVDKGLVCCEYGIPFIYIASPMLGATSPATLEGTLIQAVAEDLFGLVIFQNKVPGAKFIFGCDATQMDMKDSIFAYGAPELNLLNAGMADMAHHYKLPFFCIAGATDSKVLDAQAGMEYAMSIYNATLNGCNIIHDCGYLESGLTSSFESVLFADEVIHMVKYMMKPFDFNEETIALDVIEKVGPAKDFLSQPHTFKNFKKSFHFPKNISRERYELWEAKGKKDIRQLLNQKAKKIFYAHKVEPLPQEKLGVISTLVKGYQPDV